MRRLVVLAVAVAALASAAVASAENARLGWNEAAKAQSKAVVRFRFDRIGFKGTSWAVVCSFTNESRRAITIVPSAALLLYPSRTTDPEKPARTLPAAGIKPAFPARLGPGATWKGVIGGVGKVPDGTIVRVVVGRFTGNLPKPLGPQFWWITDHAYEVGSQVA